MSPKQKNHHHSASYLVPRVLILLVGTVFSLSLFLVTRHLEEQRALSPLQQEAQATANRLADRINDRSLALTAISQLARDSGTFTQQQFLQWATPFLNFYADINKLEWASSPENMSALHANRTDVQTSTDNQPSKQSSPKQLSLYEVPYWQDALKKARDNRQVVALASPHPTRSNDEKEIRLFLPVFNDQDVFLGFLGLSLSLPRFIESGSSISSTPGIGYRFYDLDQQTKAPLYETGAHDAFSPTQSLFYQAKYPVADRTWMVQIHPGYRYLNAQRTITPTVLAAMGMIITILIYSGYHLNALRRRQLQKQLTEHESLLKRNKKALANKGIEKGVLMQALQDSERRTRDIILLTRDYTWEVDEDGIYTFLSPKAADVKGFAPQDLLDQSIFDILKDSEKDRNLLNDAFKQARQKQISVEIELSFVTQNGESYREHLSLLSNIDSLGNCIGYRGVGFRV